MISGVYFTNYLLLFCFFLPYLLSFYSGICCCFTVFVLKCCKEFYFETLKNFYDFFFSQCRSEFTNTLGTLIVNMYENISVYLSLCSFNYRRKQKFFILAFKYTLFGN